MEEQARCKLVKRRVGVAADDGRAETECLGGGQTQLLGELVDAVGLGADQAVLARDEAEEGCQFEVAEAVDFVEELFVRHSRPRAAGEASFELSSAKSWATLESRSSY
jgi:hypothetical protein